MSIADSLLPEYDQEMVATRKCLERIPSDKFTYRPHAKSFDMGSLAVHIATVCDWGVVTMKADDFDYAPVGAPPYQPPVAKDTAELLAMFDKGRKEFRAALAAADDGAMMKPWSLLAGGKAIFTMPRIAVIRSMIFNHLIHHRGQLGVYLRLNEIAVPGIYGPSADEQ
jgi:uncharacterized damage-inducible protein DinB